MSTVEAVYEAVRADAQEALGVIVQKGFPDWGRQAAVLPVAALQVRTVAPGFANRIGAVRGRTVCGMFMTVFARNEPELCGLLDLVQSWLSKAQITATAAPVELKAEMAERYVSEAAVLQEKYAFTFPLTLTWSK